MTAFIPLTRGQCALVDDEDAPRLSGHRWCCSSNGRAIRGQRIGGRSVTILMHRQIMGLVPGDRLEVDHINRNPLDNRKSNLRIVTRSQNMMNNAGWSKSTTSRFTGVTAQNGWWKVKCAGRYVGIFKSEEVAAMAYNVAALANDPVHARLNEVEMG